MPLLRCLPIAIVLAFSAGAACAKGFTLFEGDVLGLSFSGVAPVVRIDTATGAREPLFSLFELSNQHGVAFQSDYFGVTPSGSVLLQGRTFNTPVGPFELYEFDPATGGLIRVSRFLELAFGEQTPPLLRDPLTSGDDAERIAIRPDGQIVILSGDGRGLVNLDPVTAEASVLRGDNFATNLPHAFETLLVSPSGQTIAGGPSGAWAIGATPGEDIPLGSLGSLPVIAAPGRVASFVAQSSQDNGSGFSSLDIGSGQSISLGGFGQFRPVEDPPIGSFFELDDFVVQGDNLLLAGLGDLWVWSQLFGETLTTRLENPVALPDPDVHRLLVVPEITRRPGDFNGDGLVDLADFTVWRDNLGSGHPLNGSGDESGGSAGVVDTADYLLWRERFGASLAGPPAISTSIPEPSAAMLAVAWVALLALRQRVSQTT